AHARERELVAQDVHERVVGRGRDLALEPVDGQLHETASSGASGTEAQSFSARSTFSAVIGRSVIRRPVALKTALPIAGITAGSDVSPIPCTSAPGSPSTTVMPSSGGTSRNEAIM